MSDLFSLRTLEESVEEVLEKMFFISPMEEPSGDPSLTPDISARLTFEGSPSGCLTLRMDRPAARSIAADFLGEEEVFISESQVEEVVCELANIICGSVLSHTASETTFRLSSPQVVEPSDWPGAAATSHSVELSGGSLRVSIEALDPACMAAEEFAS